ncbi:MAG: ATP-dependent Clp protease proteolytic subunit [Planctomycetota bacterium]|jgi:ATP-dependent Clp protease protease subunit
MVFWIPRVWDRSGKSEREFDLFSRLLSDRIIFIGSEITDRLANLVVAQMLFLQSENKSQDINLYVNSPGGDISAGLAIYDTMQFVQCDVATYCTGSAASMGALLLTAGSAGKRYALPHARIMIHQPWGRVAGVATDIHIHAEEMLFCRQRINELLSKHTGREVSQVEQDSDRDNYMSAQEALEYGLVDEVVTTLRQDLPKGD